MNEPVAETTPPPRRGDISTPSPLQYWRSWLPELAAVGTLGALTVWLFTGTGLDMRMATAFRSSGRFPRPTELSWLWRSLYEGAGASVAAVAAASVVVLAAGLRSVAWRRWRRHAAFVLLAVAIGPGVVVNIGFKNFWGRPRPIHVRELGGTWEYRDATEKGTAGRGKSFPCGHSSAGYVLTVFWLIWKRRQRRWAAAALVAAVFYGTALGIGRMMTGSHFASDVIASGLLVHLSNVILYYFIFNIPGREDGPPPDSLKVRISPVAIVGWGVLAAAVIVASFIATPYHSEFRYVAALAANPREGPESEIEMVFPPEDISLTLRPCEELSISGEAEGFGMFGSRLRRLGPAPVSGGALRFELKPEGWFSDLSIRLDIGLPPARVRIVRVCMPGGGLAISRPAEAPWIVDLSGASAALMSPPARASQRTSAAASDERRERSRTR